MSVTTAVHDGESRGQRSGPYVSRHAAPTPLARWAVLVGDLTRRPRRPGRFRLVGHRPLWAALTLQRSRLNADGDAGGTTRFT